MYLIIVYINMDGSVTVVGRPARPCTHFEKCYILFHGCTLHEYINVQHEYHAHCTTYTFTWKLWYSCECMTVSIRYRWYNCNISLYKRVFKPFYSLPSTHIDIITRTSVYKMKSAYNHGISHDIHCTQHDICVWYNNKNNLLSNKIVVGVTE